MTRLSVVLVLLLLISACGSPSNVEAPAPLKSIKSLYRVNVDWRKNAGSMSGSAGRMWAAASGKSIYAVNESGQVSSYDADSGKLEWTAKFDKPVSTGIAASDSLLAFATRDGEVVAASTADGAKVWSTSVLGSVLSVPAIGNGKVFVQTEDGRVVALAERDGSVVWTLERTVPSLSLHGNSGAIYKQGLLVAGFANGHVVGIDARNGRAIWDRVVSFPTGRSDVERISDVDAPPIIEGYRLFAVSYQGKVMAMDLRNGRILWSRPMSAYLPISADSQNVYVVNDEGVVVALNQESGANVWAQNDLKRRISTRPLAVNGNVVVGDKEGYIHILESGTGKIVGRYKGDGSKILGQFSVGGEIYCVSDSGQLIAYSIQAL